MKGSLNTPVRRLAVYMLLDTSASMAGSPLVVLEGAYDNVRRSVADVFLGWDTVLFSVLSYNSQVNPLYRGITYADFAEIKPLKLVAGGSSALGKALTRLNNWLAEDAGYQALGFVFTDGPGTDDWLSAAEALDPTRILILGIGCGVKANLTTLSPYMDSILSWEKHNDESFRQVLLQYKTRLNPQVK